VDKASHPTTDHQVFRSLVEQRKIAVGVDPAVARRLFTDSRMSSLRGAIGEPIPLECGITSAAYHLAFICLFVSFYFASKFFGWWSLAVIPVTAALWAYNHGKASVGRQGVVLFGLALAYLICSGSVGNGEGVPPLS
jgi:hypothetical protein